MNQSRLQVLLKQAAARRSDYVKVLKLEAFRLYDHENPEFSFAIDIYRKNAVIHIFKPISQAVYEEIEVVLRELLGVEDFFYKNRTKEEMKLPVGPQKTLVVEEYGHKFFINLSDYLDTGLFLDHRETRKWIEGQSKGKVVLNTFAYTGSFSIYAAAGGAEKTYSVDLSKTYCEWIKKNLELNGLPLEQNWVFKMDTFEFYKYARKKGLTFDIVVIDPPTFSRNKGENFSVQKDHLQLIREAMELLRPEGFVLFSNNKRDFVLYRRELADCVIQDFREASLPPDFADPLTHHCFIIRKA